MRNAGGESRLLLLPADGDVEADVVDGATLGARAGGLDGGAGVVGGRRRGGLDGGAGHGLHVDVL